jgi:hypothetical protein
MKLFGIISLDFEITDQLLIRFCVFVKYWREKREYNETVHQLFINFKKVYDSVGGEVLYSILIKLGILMKLDKVVKMCLNETYGKVHIGKLFCGSSLSKLD